MSIRTVNGVTITPLSAAAVTQIAIGIALVLIVVGVLSVFGAAHVAAAPVDALTAAANTKAAPAPRERRTKAEKATEKPTETT